MERLARVIDKTYGSESNEKIIPPQIFRYLGSNIESSGQRSKSQSQKDSFNDIENISSINTWIWLCHTGLELKVESRLAVEIVIRMLSRVNI